MQTFVYIFITTIILVGAVSTYLRKKNFSTFWIPAAVLIGISLIVAVVSYFTLDGWRSMGFFFLFFSITLGAIIGTAFSFFQKSKE
ncbi:MAG: YesK family protein [Rummeliibacillus sp.]